MNKERACNILNKFAIPITLAFFVILYILSGFREGVLFWGLVVIMIMLGRGSSLLNSLSMFDPKAKPIIILTCISVIFVITFPMSLSPAYNGHGYRDHEMMADSILSGKAYFDYDDIDPRLEEINPYDPEERESSGVSYHWDNAYYKGKYYMYFGVAPVILLFVPYKLITGTSLLSYHASQIYAVLSTIGLFLLFYEICKKYFKDTKLGAYLYMSSVLSVISIFDCIEMPAKYGLAIISGVSTMIWCLYFYIKAVLIETNEKKQVLYATLGALFGALAFGCRPSTALGNFCVIPLAIIYVKGHKDLKISKLVRNFVIIAIPYIVIGAGLMYYNYIRFENPFEFGQSYQLTMADQTQYGNLLANIDVIETINAILWNYIYYSPLSKDFPYFEQGGFLVGYPIFWLVTISFIIVMFNKYIKDKALKRTIVWSILVTVFITIMVDLWTPYMSKRYRLDIYYILAIVGFTLILVLASHLDETKRKRFNAIICTFAVLSFVLAFFLILVPFDENFAEKNPRLVQKIYEVIMLR